MILENTLYLTTPGSYAHLDHETIIVEADHVVLIRVPLHHLGAIVAYGNVLVSPYLIHRLAQDGKSLSWMTEYGAFRGKLQGPSSGNVLLRVAQQNAARQQSLELARTFVAGKIHNQRQVLVRGVRDAGTEGQRRQLLKAVHAVTAIARNVSRFTTVNALRGLEGIIGRQYFHAFPALIRQDDAAWAFTGRNRRPPKDPINALLSFGYAMLTQECQSACEVVGLDPQIGFLHVLRPGRPALALDLMEEFRAHVVDRLVLSVVNRRQITAEDFLCRPGGSVELQEKGRKTFIMAYQKRKQEEIHHEFLKQNVPIGLLPIYQAKILARVLRGDLSSYQPFLFR